MYIQIQWGHVFSWTNSINQSNPRVNLNKMAESNNVYICEFFSREEKKKISYDYSLRTLRLYDVGLFLDMYLWKQVINNRHNQKFMWVRNQPKNNRNTFNHFSSLKTFFFIR
jgi:hypothetical protein